MSRHIAIDPAPMGAKKVSVSYDGVYGFKWINQNDINDVDIVLRWAKDAGITTVILENGWKHPQLAETRRRIEDAAIRLGLDVKRVMPRTWQMICKHKPWKGTKTRSKRYAVEDMGLTLPKEQKDDYADAACMWAWAEGIRDK